jgi:hypothetical protein
MSINSETLKKIKELSDKKDKTKRQEERLKNLKEFFEKNKEKKTPKVKPEEDKKNTPIIPKDFFKNKRFNPDKMPSPYKGPFKPRPDMSPEEQRKYFMELANENPNKKGGEVKRYKAGGSVKKNKSNMITTKGWGASRKT